MSSGAARRVIGAIVEERELEDAPTVRLLRPGSSGELGELLARLGVDEAELARHRVARHACTWTGRGVDVAAGKVLCARLDFTLGGPLPMRLERTWVSASSYCGVLGPGWHHTYDVALAAGKERAAVRLADGRVIVFAAPAVGDTVFDATERLRLSRDNVGHVLRDTHGLEHRFIDHCNASASVLSSLCNLHGHALRFGYDEKARLSRVTDSAGRVLELAYGDLGRLVAMTGPTPHQVRERSTLVRYGYDRRGQLIEVWDAQKHVQRFSYDAGLIVRETDRNGYCHHYAFDQAGTGTGARCTRTWGDGGVRDHALDYEGPVTIVRNSLGQVTTYIHDGAVVRQVFDALGHVRSLARDSARRLRRLVDPLHRHVTLEHDGRGNLLEVVAADAGCTRVEYDARDQPVRLINALGASWHASYDRRGRLRRTLDPFGNATRYHYRGPWLLGVTDALGDLTRLTYDGAGNLESVNAADGGALRAQYDGWGRLVGVTDANGNARRQELDTLGRVVRIHEPDGSRRDLDYDAEGNLVRVRHGLHETRWTYMASSCVTSCTEDGASRSFEYDTELQLTSARQERALVLQATYDVTGAVVQVSSPTGVCRLERDRAGRVVRLERGTQRVSFLTYDASGRLERLQHSDGAICRFGYRLDGALSMAANEHSVVMIDRDALGRVVRERQDAHWVDTARDPIGVRLRVRSSTGTLQVFERRASGDVARLTEMSTGFAVTFTRDRVGLELERVLPGGVRARWERDLLGRPIEHLVEAGDKLLRSVQYEWIGDGRCRIKDRLQRVGGLEESWLRGVPDDRGVRTAKTVRVERTEKTMPRAEIAGFEPTCVSVPRGGQVGRSAAQLELDARDLAWSSTLETRDLARSAAFDARNSAWRSACETRDLARSSALDARDLEWSSTRDTRDTRDLALRSPLGVREPACRAALAGTRAAASALALGAAMDSECITDECGQRVEKRDPYGRVWRYQWNVAGRLIRVRLPEGSDVAFGYDALGRRVWKRHRGQTTRFIWDGALLLHEWVEGTLEPSPVDVSRRQEPVPGAAAAREREAWLERDYGVRGTRDQPVTWLFDPQGRAPVARLAGDACASIVSDERGEPVLLFDREGQPLGAADCAPWLCPFRQAGRYEDVETGLQYDGGRYYDPATRGYLNREPPVVAKPAAPHVEGVQWHGLAGGPLT